MNISRHIPALAVFATAAVALIGAAAMFGSATAAQPAAAGIVQLERVVVVGKRAPAAAEVPVVTAQLPRVVITGRSAAAADHAAATQLAAAPTKTRLL